MGVVNSCFCLFVLLGLDFGRTIAMPAQKRGVEEEEEEEEEEELVEVDDPLEHHHSNHEQHLEEPQGIDVVYYVRGFACLSFLAYSLLFPQKFINLNHRDFTYCTFRENF